MSYVRYFRALFWLFLLPASAWAEPSPKYNLPQVARVEIRRKATSSAYNKIHLEFKWNKDMPPNFPKGTAIEFQINFFPKCFAQPIGGKDDSSIIGPEYHTTLPPETEPYRDVWNYWIPESADELIAKGEARCGELSWLAKKAIWAFWGRIQSSYQEQDHAGFAIGVKRADLLRPEILYSFDYPIEVPLSPECMKFFDNKSQCKANQTNAGGTGISMQYFDNACKLGSPLGNSYTCPEFLGLKECSGADGTISWIKDLCAPTGKYEFTPQATGMSWNGIECCDDDADGFFALQGVPMYGTNVGDCNDRDASIRNQLYDASKNICVSGVCVPNNTRCDSGILYSCNSSGTAETSTVCSTSICADGRSCKTIGPCISGQKRCSGNVVEQCDGTGWKSTVTCTCGCSSGDCVGATCTAGAKQCSGPSVLTCRTDGCGWTPTADCPYGCSSGMCLPAPPPTEVCNGVDDDGNGIVDDPIYCWQKVYRFINNTTKSRCYGPSTIPPARCSGYTLERTSAVFIVSAYSNSNTREYRQCSRLQCA